jgi:hypothetical protein
MQVSANRQSISKLKLNRNALLLHLRFVVPLPRREVRQAFVVGFEFSNPDNRTANTTDTWEAVQTARPSGLGLQT